MRQIWKAARLSVMPALLATAALAEAPLGQLREEAPLQPGERVEWKSLAASLAVHGAASGFDAWTSWQRPERNRLLADGGRFTATSAGRKAGMFAGLAVAEVLVVKKWGGRHPWIARAFRLANYTSAGMLAAGGAHNLARR